MDYFWRTAGHEREFTCFTHTHAVLHHHEAALVALKTFTLEAAWCVDAGAVAAQVGGDAALVNV